MTFRLEHPFEDYGRERREEERLDEIREDGRSLYFDICLCTEDSFVGCPKHDPLYHDRKRPKNVCACGCCHSVDLGACPKFEKGANGRCVYCDHGAECHTRKNPKTYNTPLGVERRQGRARGRPANKRR